MKFSSLVVVALSLTSALAFADGPISIQGRQASDLITALKDAGATLSESSPTDRVLHVSNLNCSIEVGIRTCHFTQLQPVPPPSHAIVVKPHTAKNEQARSVITALAAAGVQPSPNPEKLVYAATSVQCESTNRDHLDFFSTECTIVE